MAALPPDETVARSRVRLASIPDGLEAEDDRKSLPKLGASVRRVMPGHLKDMIEKVNSTTNDEEQITCVIADLLVSEWALEVAEKMGVQGVPFCPFGPGILALAIHIPKLVEARIIDGIDGMH